MTIEFLDIKSEVGRDVVDQLVSSKPESVQVTVKAHPSQATS